MAVWERRVRHNLCESGVHPLTAGELLAMAGVDPGAILSIPLGYGQANGSDALRSAIAARYPGATAEQVLVTTGSAEGLFSTCWSLLQPGDRVVIPTPAYFQVEGLARNAGAEVVPIATTVEQGWQPDLDAIDRAITPDTRLVLVTNPNNPTGRRLDETVVTRLLDRAAAVGAWVIADEIYHGTELDGRATPSLWGRYERTIVSSGVSKAYGLAGLRIGWVVGPAPQVAATWWRHDYTVLAPNPTADALALEALRIEARLFERTRAILNRNADVLEATLRRFGDRVRWRRPDGGAICFVGYDSPPSSEAVAERLKSEFDVLVAPGDHFGAARHLRLGIGSEPSRHGEAVEALGRGLEAILRGR